MGELTAKGTTPIVQLTSPAAGATLGSTGKTRFDWTASDPDGDPLTFQLEASSDGVEWKVIESGLPTTSVEVDLARIPVSGSNVKLRVQAGDGLNVGVGESGPFTIGAKGPQILLISPHDRDTFRPHERVEFSAQAVSIDTGPVAPDQIQWVIDGEHVRSGRTTEWAFDSEGDHEISIRVPETGERPGAVRSIKISISNDSDFDGAPDGWERRYRLDPKDPSDSTNDGDKDMLVNVAEFESRTNPNRRDTDGDRYRDDIELAGGSDPTDPNSHPVRIHGLAGAPPKMSLWDLLPQWVWIAVAALVLIGLGVAWLRLRRTRKSQP
jgi:hypothetical protein